MTMKDLCAAVISLHRADHSNTRIVELLKEHKTNRQFVWYTVKQFQETGTIEDQSQSGWPTSKRSLEAINRMREKIRCNPKRSIRKMVKEGKMSATNMARIVKKDLLEDRALPHQRCHSAKRWVRSQVLLRELSNGMLGPVCWTDEKIFTVQPGHNSQTNQVMGKNLRSISWAKRSVFRRMKPASVMVWAGVMSNGKKLPLIFVDIGVRINRWKYKAMLEETVAPWLTPLHLSARWSTLPHSQNRPSLLPAGFPTLLEQADVAS